MLKRVAVLLLVSILALANANHLEENEISHVAKDLKGRYLTEKEEGRTELRRCGDRNACSAGLDCVRIGLYKRCIPRQDCMALEMKAFQENFDTDAYKQMLLDKAGVTESEVVGATKDLKTKDALLQNNAIGSFIETMQANPGPFDQIGDIVRNCSLPVPDRYLRKLTTDTTTTNEQTPSTNTTRRVPSRLSYGFFAGTVARQPTVQERSGLVNQTQKFYTDVLKATYPTSFVNFTVTGPIFRFVSSEADFPVSMEFTGTVLFSTVAARTPSATQIFKDMQNANYENYITRYVHQAPPSGGLFFSTQRVKFDQPVIIAPTAAPVPTATPTQSPTLQPTRTDYVGVQLEGGVGFDGSVSFIWQVIDSPIRGEPSSFGKMYVRYCLGVGLQAGGAINFMTATAETGDPDEIECLASVYDVDFAIGMSFGYAIGVCLVQDPAFLFQEITMGVGLGASLSGFSMCNALT